MSKRAFKTAASSGKATGFGGFGNSEQQTSILSFIQPPLDLSSINDPALVVVLKNLSKKASTTKTKALEDLGAWLQEHRDVDDALLEAWMKIFPRLSIENERRLRQSSHVINGKVCSAAGKRIARYMPRIAGPWYAAFYDNDKLVSRTAQEALATVISDSDKRRNARKVYQPQILEFCNDTILHETVNTLSDERTVSKDDAESTYARVIASSILLLASIIAEEGKEADQSQFEAVLDKQLFELANYADPSVRRATHALTRTILQKLPAIPPDRSKEISDIYIYKGLRSDQTGSSLQFVHTLLDLTTRQPDIWTVSYTGKKPAASRLEHFFKHGSQSGPSDFWPTLARLIDAVPFEVISTSSNELLSALRTGLNNRHERLQAREAWQAYVHIVNTLSTKQEESREEMLVKNVLPLQQQYFQPVENSEWSVSGNAAETVAALMRIHGVEPLLAQELPKVVDQLIEQMKTSLPEQSKDYTVSQTSVAAAGERWSSFQPKSLAAGGSRQPQLRALLVIQNTRLVQEALSIVTTREGKPFGSAAIVDTILRDCSSDLAANSDFATLISTFTQERLASLAFTPSARYLVKCVGFCSSNQDFEKSLQANLDSTLSSDASSQAKLEYVILLFGQKLPSQAFDIARRNECLQKLVIKSALESNGSKTSRISKLFGLGILSKETQVSCIQQLNAATRDPSTTIDALETLNDLALSHGDVLLALDAEIVSSNDHVLANTLRLTEDADEEVARLATDLSSKLTVSNGTSEPQRLRVIRQALEHADESSPSVESLHDLATRLLGKTISVSDAVACLPEATVWETNLHNDIGRPDASLSICRSFGGAINLINEEQKARAPTYDAAGLSSSLRITSFFSKLLPVVKTTSENDGTLTALAQYILFASVVLSAAEDKLAFASSNELWMTALDAEEDALEVIHEAALNITAAAKLFSHEDFVELETLACHHAATPTSAWSYYLTSAYTRLLEQRPDIVSEKTLQVRTKDRNLLENISNIISWQSRPNADQEFLKPCNELIANLTGVSLLNDSDIGLHQLIVLNTILDSSEQVLSLVAKQRIVFLVKHLIDEAQRLPERSTLEEILKALTQLLPGMSDLYGEHWAALLQLIFSIWSEIEQTEVRNTAVLYRSLKLLALLEKLSRAEDANEDLVDAIKEQQVSIGHKLLDLLQSAADVSDVGKQPVSMKNEVLGRLIQTYALTLKVDASDLFGLLYASSSSVQQAAFILLHRQIPLAQEQISLDAALDNKTAKLPDEILSLLLETPSGGSYSDAALQSYLRSWRLLFDFFENSSFKVKTDYIDQLRDGRYLFGLLNLTLDNLGINRGKPADLSIFDIARYESNMESDPQRDRLWLLAHLYYQSLLHMPSLVKSFVLEIRSRQIPATLETWTAKYISPTLIASTLDSVAVWSEKTVGEDPEYEKMSVKVASKSKEINVSYLVDEQTMSIKVVLPDAYPLASAQVVGISRVAVKEEKWQSWLRNCQGVITFSNGSVTDGLAAWRRNVTGALKGQTECAICYSIISADKQLPTKRCPTCKNLFHSSCLFKWFKTSNASTCPLCRNSFNFN